ncbi:hypothetical protein GQ55_8G232700 [Panicum hallii var. hallii]|uniref:Uncharacterized protein n=1 Tax=Panicum hallii var. hallii TaxID=1504633 RepID=A0A2T7CQE5_9POAL|nr:hypothetical protein GQ55_8G232700 [Panicum hallii var. hallii]
MLCLACHLFVRIFRSLAMFDKEGQEVFWVICSLWP